MDYKQIQDLLKAINKSSITELKVKDKDFEITIKQGSAQPAPVYQMAPQMMPAPAPAPAPAASSPADTPAPAKESTSDSSSVATNLVTVKSPMIGTFYRSSSPDKPPLVNVGDEVKKGDVVCIIEAMKLFNEIECEQSGRVVKILIDDASPVEYDQPLYMIEPS